MAEKWLGSLKSKKHIPKEFLKKTDEKWAWESLVVETCEYIEPTPYAIQTPNVIFHSILFNKHWF